MIHLQTGQFYGKTNEKISLNGITLTDTEYTHDRVEWHYHENAYFTFILQGNVIEGNKKERYACTPGTLLFHNWQEAHYNVKPLGFTRGFHVELEQRWIDQFSVRLDGLQGSIPVLNPTSKLLLYKIFRETKTNDETSLLSVESLLLQTLSGMKHILEAPVKSKPLWAKNVTAILHDRCTEKISLTELSEELGIHPVHLSREFPKYFQCGLGQYIRRLKIEKSLSLLSNKKKSLTDIAFNCGFSDQSHFTRCFREMMGTNPHTYRKLLLG